MAAIVSTRIIRLQAVSPRTAAAVLQSNINIPAATLIDGTLASTVVTGAADGASALAAVGAKLAKAGGDTLTGIVDVDVTTNFAAGFRAGTVTWNSTTGAITSGTGVVMTRLGLIGVAAGVTTFSIDVATGAPTFSGTVTATAGAIGGFTLASSSLTAGSGATAVGMASSGTYFFWAGSSTAASAPFRLETTGDMTVDKITVGTLTGSVTGNVTGNVTGSSGSCTGNTAGSSSSCTGNSSTATSLINSRLIGGSSFNGTANITVDAATVGGQGGILYNLGGTTATTLAGYLTIGSTAGGSVKMAYYT